MDTDQEIRCRDSSTRSRSCSRSRRSAVQSNTTVSFGTINNPTSGQITANRMDGNGAGDKNSLVSRSNCRRAPTIKPGSLQSYLRNRHHVTGGSRSVSGSPAPPPLPVDSSRYLRPGDAHNRSIEIFFGNLTNVGSFCTSLSGVKGVPPTKDKPLENPVEVKSSSKNKSKTKSKVDSKPVEDVQDRDEKSSKKKSSNLNKDPAALLNPNPTPPSIFALCRPVSVPQIDDSLESFPSYHLRETSKTSRLKRVKAMTARANEDNNSTTGSFQDIDDFDEELDDDDDGSCDDSEEEGNSEEAVVEEVVVPKKQKVEPVVEPPKLDDDREEFEAIPNPLNTTVDPCAVKKLCLVGHPLTSFKGLNNFKKLHEAWITDCAIRDLRWQDFKNLKFLQRLYLFGGEISTIEPLHFENLRVLWLSNNKLTCLNFLTFGMPQLAELNVANNEITCLEAEDLFKCSYLQNFNVSGNPLCTVQDVENVNVISTLKEFYLVDPSYGKCPVASLCESRSLLVNRLKNVKILNGKVITDAEREDVQVYVSQRCLYYYGSSVTCSSSHTAMRKMALQGAYKQLESLGGRITQLSELSAKCLQADYQMTGLPNFTKTKQLLLVDVAKVHTRLSHLKQWNRVVLRRVESLLRISRWEQELDTWMKWVEFKSFGTIQSYISHSVADPGASNDKDNIRAAIHQLISALSCKKPWPRHTLFKLETIVVIKDKGAEAGMEKIYEDNYARKNEPRFIPPPPLDEDIGPPTPPDTYSMLSGQPFYGPPSIQPLRVVPTYIDPEYKAPPPAFSYPESVPGLPERSQPIFLFLITGTGSGKNCNDPLHYFHNLLFEKSRYFKDVRLTNCIWTATQINAQESQMKSHRNAHSLLFVVKVLEECLVPVGKSRQCYSKHSNDCMIFALRRPLSYSPAYIVNISHVPNDKKGNWYERVCDDKDVTVSVGRMLDDIANRISDTGVVNVRKNVPYYLHRTHDGMKADLTAVTKLMLLAPKSADTLAKPRNGAELLSVTKFLGPKISETITSLDLSTNNLGLAVGLEGMTNLRKLNLSHNNLTTLSGLHKLPKLKELKTGWNCLRFFHSNLNTLVWACSNLQVLEILPNPFQDVRDYAHIPILASGYLSSLKRVDAWIAPFQLPSQYPISTSPELASIDTNFSKEVLKFTWVGDNVHCMDYSGRCATDLDILPPGPYDKDASSLHRNGVLLNLSDNYLTSTSLCTSPIVQNTEWKSFLVKLDLKENCITNLEWMEANMFPNMRILNVSNNQLSDVDPIGIACPKLIHLQISGNPLPCNLPVLQPLSKLLELTTLDASRTPIATHPNYAAFVMGNLMRVQILDGIGLMDWNTQDAVGCAGGILSHDWLEKQIGMKNWNHLTELSLPNCDLQTVEFPCGSLPKLLSLDLTGNSLTHLSGFSSLPKLRVLCLTNNRIKSLGESCPTCYEQRPTEAHGVGNTKNSEQQTNGVNQLRSGGPDQKFPKMPDILSTSSSMAKFFVNKPQQHPSFVKGDSGNLFNNSGGNGNNSAGRRSKGNNSKMHFPNLEVLVLSHNGLTSVEDLHLHSLPSLRTVILNCNKIKGFEGLDNLTTLRALVLDNNQITQIPFSSMMGCNSLRHLHLEHNRITALPRLPNLRHLSALHIGYNRIQSLTDIGCLGQLEMQELTILGNPSCKSDYWKSIVSELPKLQKLDGVSVLQLKMAKECGKKWSTKADPTVNDSSDDWEDIHELPPGYIPDGGLRVKSLPTAYQSKLRHDGNE